MSDRSDNNDQLFEVPPSRGAPSRVESKIRYLLLDGCLEEAQVAKGGLCQQVIRLKYETFSVALHEPCPHALSTRRKGMSPATP